MAVELVLYWWGCVGGGGGGDGGGGYRERGIGLGGVEVFDNVIENYGDK